MTKQTLDLTAVWNDAVDMLKNHKEAALAIASVFIFLPSWVFAYFVGDPDMAGATTNDQQLAILVDYFRENWLMILMNAVITSFGSLSFFVVLTHNNIGSIGNALKKALIIFPIFFIVSIITNFLTGLGIFALLIGALYLTGRFSTVAGVVAAESERGIFGSIQYAWKLTGNVGWMAFLMLFVVAIVGFVVSTVIELVFGLVFNLIGGTTASLLSTGLGSALGAILSLLIGAIMIAIYRHLKPQVDGAIPTA